MIHCIGPGNRILTSSSFERLIPLRVMAMTRLPALAGCPPTPYIGILGLDGESRGEDMFVVMIAASGTRGL